MAKQKKDAKPKRLKGGSFWQAVKSVKEDRSAEKATKTRIKENQTAVVAEMQARGETKIVSADYGLQVTLTEKETPEYDRDGIWKDLTPRQRPKCFDRTFDIMALPTDRRAELLKALRESLTPAELRACTVDTLNVERLSQAVQAGDIDAEVVAKHVTFKKQAPYITVTDAGSE